MDQNQSMVIINLKWKTWRKKLYLGIENSEQGKKKHQQALKEIEAMGYVVNSWEEFFNKAIDIFKSYNIIRVDH